MIEYYGARSMNIQETAIHVLRGLGLKDVQTRVYLCLEHTEALTAKEISKATNVRREDVYRVLPHLLELSLIEKIIDFPAKFRAVPLKTAVCTLYQRRKKQNSEVQREITKLTSTLLKNREKKQNRMDVEDETQFVLVPKKETFLRYLENTPNRTRESLEIMITWKNFSSTLYARPKLRGRLEAAAKRDVKLRILLDKPDCGETAFELLESMMKRQPSMSVRCTNTPIDTVLRIYDKKEVLINTVAEGDLTEYPALLTRNHSVISMALKFFEIQWITAKEIKLRNSLSDNKSASRKLILNSIA